MKSKELYTELADAFSDENLNRITRKLIMLYKNKNFGKIREIANKISKYVSIEEEKDAKCFSKLIMLYHPDKGDQLRKSIKDLYEQNDFENLKKHSHILLLNNLDTVQVSASVDTTIEFDPEYVWNVDLNDGYGYSDTGEEDDYEYDSDVNDFDKSFYNLIKIREYGRVDIEFPTYYLEDYEEFELSESGLESLDGVEYCKHIKILDVSNNCLSDISNLWDLESMEELYLANNQIGYIDALCNLVNLRVLDLSGNQVDDVSPLFDLTKLEYVNLIGNKIPAGQINILRNNGIIVMV